MMTMCDVDPRNGDTDNTTRRTLSADDRRGVYNDFLFDASVSGAA